MYGSLCGERNLIIVLSYVSWRTEVIREFKENGIIYPNKVAFFDKLIFSASPTVQLPRNKQYRNCLERELDKFLEKFIMLADIFYTFLNF